MTDEVVEYLDSNADKIKAPLAPLNYAAVAPSSVKEASPLTYNGVLSASVPLPIVLALVAAASLLSALASRRMARQQPSSAVAPEQEAAAPML